DVLPEKLAGRQEAQHVRIPIAVEWVNGSDERQRRRTGHVPEQHEGIVLGLARDDEGFARFEFGDLSHCDRRGPTHVGFPRELRGIEAAHRAPYHRFRIPIDPAPRTDTDMMVTERWHGGNLLLQMIAVIAIRGHRRTAVAGEKTDRLVRLDWAARKLLG